MKIFSNVFGHSDDENIFLQKLLLTNTQVSKLRKVSANNSSANTELSKTQLHKIGESWGLVGRVLGPLLKNGLPLIGHVLKPLAKCALIPLGAATDVAIHKKLFGSGVTTLITSNEEMNDIMKIVWSLDESGLFIKSVSKKIKNEQLKK